MSRRYELAQVNYSRLTSPLDAPELASFVAALDEVNAAADAADGFVWRLQGDDGNATSLRAFAWDQGSAPGLIVNLSVWRDVDALKSFVFAGRHLWALRHRADWFERPALATTALWWVRAGHRPTIVEAEDAVLALRARGPTSRAFDLRRPYPPPCLPPPAR